MGWNYDFNGEWKFSRNLSEEELKEIRKIIKEYEYDIKADKNRNFDKYKEFLKQQKRKWKGPIFEIGFSFKDNIPLGYECCWTVEKNKISCHEFGSIRCFKEWIVFLIDKFFLPKNIRINGEMKYIYTDSCQAETGSIIIEDNNITIWEDKYDFDYNIIEVEKTLIYNGKEFNKTKL